MGGLICLVEDYASVTRCPPMSMCRQKQRGSTYREVLQRVGYGTDVIIAGCHLLEPFSPYESGQ